MVTLPRIAVHRPSRLRRSGAVALLAFALLLPVQKANAQVGIVPPPTQFSTKNLRIELGFPANAVPANVSGFRVNLFCTLSPATFDGGWSAIITYGATGTAATVPTPFNANTQCNLRLTVLGVGNRPLILGANSFDAVNVTFRYLDTVDGVAVDPQTVIEIGPFMVKDISTVRFGAAAPAPPTTTTATTAPTTTTTTTTLPPTTTTTTTTTVAPPPTTVAPRPATITTAPRRTVRICVKWVKGKCTVTRLVRR